MINFKNATFALTLALTVMAGAAAPAMAKSGVHHSGHAARAQAIGADVGGGLSRARANALRECNDAAAPLKDYTWGVTGIDSYRSCMTQHGQPE